MLVYRIYYIIINSKGLEEKVYIGKSTRGTGSIYMRKFHALKRAKYLTEKWDEEGDTLHVEEYELVLKGEVK